MVMVLYHNWVTITFYWTTKEIFSIADHSCPGAKIQTLLSQCSWIFVTGKLTADKDVADTQRRWRACYALWCLTSMKIDIPVSRIFGLFLLFFCIFQAGRGSEVEKCRPD